MRLDDRDQRILGVLQSEGRITNQRLAERVALSPSACLERLRRLEEGGVIRGYRALVALDRVARSTTVFVQLTLKRHEAGDFQRFEQAVKVVPEIVECHAIGGGADYLLKVVAVDIEHYQEVIEALLAADLGIATYFTWIVTKPVKREPEPIAALVARDRRTPG